MSIGREHDKSKAPNVKVNGVSINVPDNWAGYDQGNRDLFFGAIEIPIPFNLLTSDNEIAITFNDTGGHISTVIMEVNNEIDPITTTTSVTL